MMKHPVYRHILCVSLIITLFLALGSQAWAQEERGMFVPDDLLPTELQGMAVKDYFVPADGEEVGTISMLEGNLVVLHKDTGEAYFPQEGDAIFEQDVFYTLRDSKCRLNFNNADVVSMAADTKISIDEMVDDRGNKEKKSMISMLRGRAMFYVVKLFKYRKASASVNTPTAVCGVRGTKFGVEVVEKDTKSANGIPVYLADLSQPAETASDLPVFLLAQAGSGVTVTTVFVFEGSVVLNLSDGSTLTLTEDEWGRVDSAGNKSSGALTPEMQSLFEQLTGGTGDGTGGTGDGIGGIGDLGDGELDPEELAGELQELINNITGQTTIPSTW